MSRHLLWFRNDLRLHDHPALLASLERADVWVPLYIFDPRIFAKTDHGWPRTGHFRGRFMWQSVADLRRQLQERGRDLIIRVGIPEQIIPELCRQFALTHLFFGKEFSPYEETQEQVLINELSDLGVRWHLSETASLYHLEQLPFRRNAIPDTFTSFRHWVEALSQPGDPLDLPASLPRMPDIALGEIPSLSAFGLAEVVPDDRASIFFKGGETAGLARLKEFVWDTQAVKSYFLTRNEMVGKNNSSKFSAWLSIGCLSARQIIHEIKAFEKQYGADKSTYWLGFELLWRDFFRFNMAKNGRKYFRASGLKEKITVKSKNPELLKNWIYGKTGDELVDANMNELRLTGYMSNRGRQNVASYFVHDIQMDWRIGASWFEHQLVDYDVYSNYGNWAYVAGVGCDPRKDRYFNTSRQSMLYDSSGTYRKRWLV
ncbi:DASH family cryptochrome [Terrimonas ferruginea]|uniref:DASH family cryptochrome n=1 Tax=Terrimonas ferruginea TaxID=249 RepID=UPI0003FB40A8|nr:DASH family cryptochrome [Terrimonas ferruginea]